jgi:hypothetical protein
MVKTAGRRGTDVHGGAFTDGIEALQDLNRTGVIAHEMLFPQRFREASKRTAVPVEPRLESSWEPSRGEVAKGAPDGTQESLQNL